MERSTGTHKSLQVDIEGMFCPNCETVIERRFKKIRGVHSARASAATATATVEHDGSIDLAALQAALADEPYRVLPAGEGSRVLKSGRDYVEIGAVFVVLLAFYLLLRQFDVFSGSVGVSENVSYGLAFLIGLVASVSSCMAVTGGLLVAAAAKYNEVSGARPGAERFEPLIYFNVGRVVSYTILGAAIGALGSALSLSPFVNGVITLVVSVVMILLGLQLLRIVPTFDRLLPDTSRLIANKINALIGTKVKGSAFALGAATFFLPCGFTQALQLYVLGLGEPLTGALVMLAFALGTLPALMSLSALTSFASGRVQSYFLKFAGAAVIVLGIFNLQAGLTLTSADMAGQTAVVPSGGAGPQQTRTSTQVLKMRVAGLDYFPNRFTVTEGSSVEWRIDAAGAAGCGRILISPGLGIRTRLSNNGDTTIRFIAPQPGEYGFNCGMGMMTEDSVITVVPSG